MYLILNFDFPEKSSNMPKKRVSDLRPNIRRYGIKSRYTQEQLDKILEEVKGGVISERQAARKYDIPRNTIRNKLKGYHSKSVGRPTVFSEEEEKSIVRHVMSLSDIGLPISLFDVRCVAQSYLNSQARRVKQFKQNLPGWDWSQSFLKRNEAELTQRFQTNISRKRAQVNEQILNQFFDNLEHEILDVLPENIYNYDETGFHDIPSKRKLLFRRGCRNPERIINSTKSCFTTLFCGNAAGNFIPPYVIMKGAQKWSDWIYGAPSGSRLNTSKSGWIDNSVFDDWFANHFLPEANRTEGKKVLIGDNMSAHITIRTLQLARENNISLIYFPPNSTHVLQPLDVGYFSSLKTYWRQVLMKWRETKGGKKTVALPKSVFCQLLKASLDRGKETAAQNLKKGFEATGIYPLNRQKVLQNLPLYARTLTEINESIGEQFKVYLENVRKNDLENVQRARKFCLPVTAGKSVSVEEVNQYYQNKALSKSGNASRSMTDKINRGGPKTRGGSKARGGCRTQGIRTNRKPREEQDSAPTATSVQESEKNQMLDGRGLSKEIQQGSEIDKKQMLDYENERDLEIREEQMLDYGDLSGQMVVDEETEDRLLGQATDIQESNDDCFDIMDMPIDIVAEVEDNDKTCERKKDKVDKVQDNENRISGKQHKQIKTQNMTEVIASSYVPHVAKLNKNDLPVEKTKYFRNPELFSGLCYACALNLSKNAVGIKCKKCIRSYHFHCIKTKHLHSSNTDTFLCQPCLKKYK